MPARQPGRRASRAGQPQRSGRPAAEPDARFRLGPGRARRQRAGVRLAAGVALAAHAGSVSTGPRAKGAASGRGFCERQQAAVRSGRGRCWWAARRSPTRAFWRSPVQPAGQKAIVLQSSIRSPRAGLPAPIRWTFATMPIGAIRCLELDPSPCRPSSTSVWPAASPPGATGPRLLRAAATLAEAGWS